MGNRKQIHQPGTTNTIGGREGAPATPAVGQGKCAARPTGASAVIADEQHELFDVWELANTVPHKMWFSGPRGGILFFNARYYEFTGLKSEQALGMGWCVAIHPDDLERCMRPHARDRAVQEHHEWTFEYRLRRRDGEYRWHLGRDVPLFDENGMLCRWIGTATEIHEARVATQKQRRFLREVLFAVTEKRLRLCDSAEELPAAPGDSRMDNAPVLLTCETLSTFRHLVAAACEKSGFSRERTGDLVMAAGEAAMNAVVHGGGNGRGSVYTTQASGGMVQVRVEDAGTGIAEDSLHRATLEPGFSSAGTFGHGFPLMLRLSDRIYLLTGSTGTTVVVEQYHTTPEPGVPESVWVK